jgi:Polyketide cyclase / dehydrase and lipid transport
VGRWITRAERTLTEDVPAPPERVRGFYTDLHNIKLVHPLVVSVRSTSRHETADGYVQTYRVRDRIPLGPFTLRTSYRTCLQVAVSGDVLSEARQFPGVRLRSTVAFEPISGGTRVVERMTITAPRPLAGVTTRGAVRAHVAMLAGIRRRFEPTPN